MEDCSFNPPTYGIKGFHYTLDKKGRAVFVDRSDLGKLAEGTVVYKVPSEDGSLEARRAADSTINFLVRLIPHHEEYRSRYNKKGVHVWERSPLDKLSGADLTAAIARDPAKAWSEGLQDRIPPAVRRSAFFYPNGMCRLTRSPFDADGWDRDGYGRDGYNRAGGFFETTRLQMTLEEVASRRGLFDEKGLSRVTKGVYDEYGLDINGHNRRSARQVDAGGFDSDGVHWRTGTLFNTYGVDKAGRGPDGRDLMGGPQRRSELVGLDVYGLDERGVKPVRRANLEAPVDRYDVLMPGVLDGVDERGNITGYTAEGFDIRGIDRDGRDKFGILRLPQPPAEAAGVWVDPYGRDANGDFIDSYGPDGFNSRGYDRHYLDRRGFTVHGAIKDTWSESAQQESLWRVWRQPPADTRGTIVFHDKDGFDVAGYHATTGRDKDGFDRNGFDSDGVCGHTGTRFNNLGFDHEGYDIDGYDSNGFNKDGVDRSGFPVTREELEARARRANSILIDDANGHVRRYVHDPQKLGDWMSAERSFYDVSWEDAELMRSKNRH